MTAHTDRELLELAAKAAGIVGTWNGHGLLIQFDEDGRLRCWNSIDDDGDALRLAVKMDFTVEQNVTFCRSCVLAYLPGQKSMFATAFFEPWADDKQAATRRAITRVAAAIGEAMP